MVTVEAEVEVAWESGAGVVVDGTTFAAGRCGELEEPFEHPNSSPVTVRTKVAARRTLSWHIAIEPYRLTPQTIMTFS